MDLQRNWPQVRATFDAAIKSSMHCAIATTSADGQPHITPIGHVFLRDDYTAFYFEEHPKQLPRNLDENPRVCLLLVNSNRWFWLRSLFAGTFKTPPGMRLTGVAGTRRPASSEEKAAYEARVKPFRSLRGYQLIWKDLSHVRDIKLDQVLPILYPTMTEGLWQ